MKSYLDNIQVRFHQLLQNFLNGYTLDRKSKILYPLLDKNIIPTEWSEMILALGEELPKTSAYLKNNNNGDPASVARLISIFYSEFYSKGKEGTTKCEVRIGKDFEAWHNDASKIQDKKLGIVYKIKTHVTRNLSSEIVDFFVHGSFSTLDYTEWSDLDLIAIVKNETLADYNRLLSLRKKLIKLNKILFYNDPLQHHGCNIICEPEMNYYPSSFFPPNLFSYSTSFYGTKSLQFIVRDSSKEALALLKGHLSSADMYFDKTRPSLYDWKLFCHTILLIPALYLENKHIYVYKRHSYEQAKEDFASKEWAIVERIGEVRNNFFFNPLWVNILLRLSPSYWQPKIVLMFYPKAPKHLNEIKTEVHNFTNAVRTKI